MVQANQLKKQKQRPVKMAREMACRKCKRVTTEKVCPGCKSSDLTPDWNGVVLVVNPADSKIADTLNITQKGKYAIKVTQKILNL